MLDDLDACPNTPAGALVNSAGCPAETVSVTLDIKFDAGQFAVKPAFDEQIGKVADFMARFPTPRSSLKATPITRGTPPRAFRSPSGGPTRCAKFSWPSPTRRPDV